MGISTLKQFNLFVNGAGFVGTITKLQLPSIADITSDIITGDRATAIKVVTGVELGELSFTCVDIIDTRLTGLLYEKDTILTIKSIYSDSDSEDDKGVIITAVIASRSREIAELEKGGETSQSFTFSLKSYREVVDNVTIYDINTAPILTTL